MGTVLASTAVCPNMSADNLPVPIFWWMRSWIVVVLKQHSDMVRARDVLMEIFVASKAFHVKMICTNSYQTLFADTNSYSATDQRIGIFSQAMNIFWKQVTHFLQHCPKHENIETFMSLSSPRRQWHWPNRNKYSGTADHIYKMLNMVILLSPSSS